jgi:threonine/homoserine/homoserine lactone efflux protein
VSIVVFTGATLVASLTPGPAVLLAIGTSIRGGVAAAARAIAGITLGNLIYVLIALAGLLALLSRYRGLLRILQIAGAAYLVFLGIRMIASAPALAVKSAQRPFTNGLVTQLSNPKSIVYWTALVPPFLDTARPLTAQVTLIAAIGCAVDVLVLLGYALAAARVRLWLSHPRHARALNLAAGMLFAVIGCLLLVASYAEK